MSYARALIVDDSKIARVTLKKKLEQRGLETVVAEDAQQALDLLKTEAVDVVFMDHMMPGMDGFEATQQIKANEATAHLPVIMCSGKENDGYLDEARAIGAAHVLPKPTASEALDAVFEELEHAPIMPADPVILVDLEAREDQEPIIDAGALPSAANSDNEQQFQDLLVPLAQQVSDLGGRLNKLHDDIGAQITSSSEVLAHMQTLEQRQAAAPHVDEEQIKTQLLELLTQRLEQQLAEQLAAQLETIYLPATEAAREQSQEELRGELGGALDDKLAEAMERAVTELKSALPKPPAAAEIKRLVRQHADESLTEIHTELKQTQQQLGAALRVELERHIKSELASQVTPEQSMAGLRENMMDELRGELAECIPVEQPRSNSKLPIALTLLSTLVAGVAVALHFVL